jgi:hypothetical protein
MGNDKQTIYDSKLSEIISRLVKEVKYGNITLIIQDGKVIQIDKTEKIRL